MKHFLFPWVIATVLNLGIFAYAWADAVKPLGDNPNFTRVAINPVESVGEILAITQDHLGFLWFAGRSGLARYDGYRFHTYRADPKDPSALGNPYLTDVFEDSFGELWVATYGGGVARLNRKTDNFQTYKYEKNNNGAISLQKFDAILEDDQRNLWIVGVDGVAMYDRAQDVFIRYLTDAPEITEPILEMVQIQTDEFLLVTAAGVYIWNKLTGGLEKFQPSNSNNKIMPLAVTRSSLKDSRGNIWIGHEKGLYKFIPKTRTFESIPLKSVIEDISAVSIWKLTEDKNGILWIGTDGNGLMYYNPKTEEFGAYTRNVSPSSLGTPVVRTVFEDKVGDLWVSTFPSGLYHYNKTNNFFSYFSNFIKTKSDLFANTTWAFLEDSRRNIWLGIDSLGLVYFERATNTFSQSYEGFNFAEHKFPNSVLSLLQDTHGNLWMGTWAQGVTRFNPKTKEYKHLNPNLAGNTQFEGESVWDILESKNGDIYFGTMNQGIIHYSYTTDTYTTYRNNHDGTRSPNNNAGWSLVEADDGRIWIGTNRGINIFDPKTKLFSYLENQPDKENSISSNSAIWLFKDSKSRMWVCTNGGGLNLYHPENNTFSRISTEEGLRGKDVQGVVEDSNGLLWFTNTNNITSLNPETFERHTYTDKSWIQNGEFSHGAILKLASGELMFGGTNGFNILDPNKVTSNLAKPSIFFTELELLNRSIVPAEKNSVIQSDILDARSITLTHEDPMFSLRFTATNYRAHGDNIYTYKLEGFDTEWHKESNYNKATYTHLDAGHYRFLVRAANNDNIWADEAKSIDIIVLPAPWKTWWAYCIYVGTILGLIVWYVTAQQNKYIREKRLNEKLLELDKLKNDFMANTSHELRTPVNGIIGIAQALQDGVAGLQTPDTLQHLGMILGCGKRLERLINDVLDFSTSKSANLKFQSTCFSVGPLIEEVIFECGQSINSQQLQIINKASGPYPLLFGDSELTRRVIYNLVTNAIKYTEKGFITVSVEILEQTLCIAIEDTGIGIASEDLQKIYESFTQIADSGAHSKNGTGLGLSLAKYFVEAQGGQLQAASRLGVGTTFKVTLPQATAAQIAQITDTVPMMAAAPLNYSLTGQGQAIADAHSPAVVMVATPGETLLSTVESGSIKTEALPVFYPKNYAPNLTFKTILVVDDESINRTILRSLGLRHGYIIYEAANGQEAVDALNNGLAADLILLDIMMPKLSGIETCRIIREKFTQTQLPIIFISAKTQINDIEECFKAQGNDFVPKPINRDDLLLRMKQLLDNNLYDKAANH